MKLIRFIIRFAFVAFLMSSCISCVEPGGVSAGHLPDPSLDVYRINISFKDAAGHDLLEQMAYYKSDPTSPKYLGEVDPEKLTLTIVSSTIYPLDTFYFNMAKFDDIHSWMKTDKNGVYPNRGTWYLSNDFVIESKYNGAPYSPLIYNISCPVLFGGIHGVRTWWEKGAEDKESGQHFPKCVKATFNGKEVKVVQGITLNEKAEPYYIGYFLDIVLEGHIFY